MNSALARKVTILLLSVITALVVFTYFLQAPFTLLKPHALIVEECYHDVFPNAIYSIGYVALYLMLAQCLIDQTRLTDATHKVLVVAITTAALTSFVCYYFTQRAPTPTFFSRWFYEVRFKAVVHDVLLLVMTYLVYDRLDGLISP